MAEYPGSIKNFLTLQDGVDKVIAAHPNDRAGEITAIETELGIDVAGSAADLKTRLAVAVNDDGSLKTIAADKVITTSLKTALNEVSMTGAGHNNVAHTGGEYSFNAQFKEAAGTVLWIQQSCGYPGGNVAGANLTTSYTGPWISGDPGPSTLYSQTRYVTASGTDWFVFLKVDKVTGEIRCLSSGSDHPSYGSGGDYKNFPHPFGNVDLDKYEIVLLDKETVAKLKEESTDIDEETGTKRLATLINENYKVNLTKKEPYIPLHSGKYKKTLKNGKEVVIKHMIEIIPDYISVRKLIKLTQTEKDERKRKHKLEQEKHDMAQAQKMANKANGIIKLRELGLTNDEIGAVIE